MSISALMNQLAPLQQFLSSDRVTEICLNRPGEIFVEQAGEFKRHELPELNYSMLYALATLFAEYNHLHFPQALLSGSLPAGQRMQMVLSPVASEESIAFSIRCPYVNEVNIEDYLRNDSLPESPSSGNEDADLEDQIRLYFAQKKIAKFLALAVKTKKNILISGGTGSGKTTLLNACIKLIPSQERIITIEDTREVSVPHENTLNLLFHADKNIDALTVFKSCLRLRPDRIIMSELRDYSEAYPYLRAINSGHPGSITTLHADNAHGCFDQLAFMMLQAGSHISRNELINFAKTVIKVVVQIQRTSIGQRYISQIYYDGVVVDVC